MNGKSRQKRLGAPQQREGGEASQKECRTRPCKVRLASTHPCRCGIVPCIRRLRQIAERFELTEVPVHPTPMYPKRADGNAQRSPMTSQQVNSEDMRRAICPRPQSRQRAWVSPSQTRAARAPADVDVRLVGRGPPMGWDAGACSRQDFPLTPGRDSATPLCQSAEPPPPPAQSPLKTGVLSAENTSVSESRRPRQGRIRHLDQSDQGRIPYPLSRSDILRSFRRGLLLLRLIRCCHVRTPVRIALIPGGLCISPLRLR